MVARYGLLEMREKHTLPMDDQEEFDVSVMCSNVGCRLAIETLSCMPETMLLFICCIASSAESIFSNVTKAQLKFLKSC